MRFTILPDLFAICRLPPDAEPPNWAMSGEFCSVTRAPGELSVVCRQSQVPSGVLSSPEWRCLRVHGPMDLALTGVLASLARPLAQAGIAIFAVSTYDTDYLLVKAADLDQALLALTGAGHVSEGGEAGQRSAVLRTP
jgi:uncharacterized protein